MRAMQIIADTVAALKYEVHDDEGRLVDQSSAHKPFYYLHGHNEVAPGLEKALAGREKGQNFKVILKPDDAYGRRDEEQIIKLDVRDLPEGSTPKVGMMVRFLEGEFDRAFRIVDVGDFDVTLDGNHPLAGINLHFQVEVQDVRKATPKEIALGQPIVA